MTLQHDIKHPTECPTCHLTDIGLVITTEYLYEGANLMAWYGLDPNKHARKPDVYRLFFRYECLACHSEVPAP